MSIAASLSGYPGTQGPDWRSLLECPLCLSALSFPVATACGHTFCSDCLAKALISSAQCPLCRAPCYLQPSYRHGRKPVVVLEKLLEMAYGSAGNSSNSDLKERKQVGAFRLGLFFLSERYFSPVPHRAIKLRAFEPYVLLLVRRCVEHGVRMGIQSSRDSQHGYLVRVDKIAPFPDRFHSHHLLVQCYVEGLYKLVGPLEEEANTGGLHYAQVEEICMEVGTDDPSVSNLAARARNLFQSAVGRLQPGEATAIFEDVYSGTMRVLPEDTCELSYFLIEALNFPGREEEESLIFEPSVKRRLEQCILYLDVSSVDFKRVSNRRSQIRTRETLDLTRNVLLASGVMVFLGVAFGGLESLSWIPFLRRS